MSEAPFMPLWVGDFMTKTIGLDARETGAYMMLIMALWANGGTLPNDEKKLRLIARCGRDWPKVWGGISHYFDVTGDVISQKRVTLELQKMNAKREANSRNGALGGKAKALKNNNADVANATISPKQSESESDIIEGPKGPLSSDDDAQAAFDAYNIAASEAGWPKAQSLNKARRSKLKARLREAGGLTGWEVALAKARASPHCCGDNARGWTADLDFLLQAKSFTRLMEGSYDERTGTRSASGSHAGPRGSHHGFMAGFAHVANQGRQ